MPKHWEPLIGVDNMETPYWARGQEEAANASVWAIARAAPRTVVSFIRWSWLASRRLTISAALVQATVAITTAFGLLATADVFTSLLAQGPTAQRVLDSLPALGVLVSAVAARGLLQATAGMLQGELQPRIELRVLDELYARLLDVEAISFEDADFAALVERTTMLAPLQLRSGTQLAAELLGTLVSVTAAVTAAGLLNPVLAPLVLLVAIPQAWAGMRAAQLQLAAIVRTNSDMRRRDVTGRLISRRENAAEIRALTAQRTLLREYRRIAESLAKDAIDVGRSRNLVEIFGRLLSGLCLGVAYAVLGLLIYFGWLPLPLAGTAVLAIRTANQSVTSGIIAMNQLFDIGIFVDLHRACVEDAQRRRRPEPRARLGAELKTIDLSNVSFSYPGATAPAVRKVDLTLRTGCVVALVGENGSGKTTLAKLICGLYQPGEGAVRWDGVETGLVDPIELHDRVSLVMQEPVRWPVTAENNIRIGRIERVDPRGTHLARAASQAGADVVLAGLADGGRTVLSRDFQGGQDLSGGQWQRISVARGLYRDADVVVADEPTAAMDARAEQRVFDALRSLSDHGAAERGRLTVLITHRLANIRHADQIVVLDNGAVVESGSHEELMGNKGRYHDLFTLQANGYAIR